MTDILKRTGIPTDAINQFLNRHSIGDQRPRSIAPNDYPKGFLIQELAFETITEDTITDPEGILSEVRLIGNQMPKVPFTFGGEQRITKMYYPGEPEPSTQVLGPTETDVMINGQLKDVRYPSSLLGREKGLTGYSVFIRDELDRIRYGGRLCRFTLGAWKRYGYISKTEFKIARESRMDYSLTLLIVSINKLPTNLKIITDEVKNIPFKTSEDLRIISGNIMGILNSLPTYIPEPTLAERILNIVDQVARSINEVTGYVDSVFRRVGEIRQSIDRALGLIDFTKNKVREMQIQLGLLDPFESSASVEQKLNQAAFNTFMLSNSVSLNRTLLRFRNEFRAIADRLPQQVYLPIQGDTWPKIATKIYGSPDDWRLIAEYNNFDICEPVPIGERIEIPRQS